MSEVSLPRAGVTSTVQLYTLKCCCTDVCFMVFFKVISSHNIFPMIMKLNDNTNTDNYLTELVTHDVTHSDRP